MFRGIVAEQIRHTGGMPASPVLSAAVLYEEPATRRDDTTHPDPHCRQRNDGASFVGPGTPHASGRTHCCVPWLKLPGVPKESCRSLIESAWRARDFAPFRGGDARKPLRGPVKRNGSDEWEGYAGADARNCNRERYWGSQK
jgi:hypothetical protein